MIGHSEQDNQERPASPRADIDLPEPPPIRGRDVQIQRGDAGHASWRIRVAHVLLRALFRLLFRVRVQGLEHVPVAPVIVCANHLGWADVFLLLAFLPVEPRLYALGDRATVVCNDRRQRIINAFQVLVPLDPDQPHQAIRTMADVLRRGGSLIIFPEGHLGEHEATLQPLQPGAAHLSLRSGTPLLPIGLTGTKDLWLRRHLTVRIGVPIDPACATAGPPRQRIHTLTTMLDAALRDLLPGDDEQTRITLLRDPLTNLL